MSCFSTYHACTYLLGNLPTFIPASELGPEIYSYCSILITKLSPNSEPETFCKHIHAYIHTYIYTCIHTYVRTYVRAYIHAYIHVRCLFLCSGTGKRFSNRKESGCLPLLNAEPEGKSMTPNRQQAECPLTNWVFEDQAKIWTRQPVLMMSEPGTSCWVQVFAWSSITEQNTLSPFDSKIACPYRSKNKHV